MAVGGSGVSRGSGLHVVHPLVVVKFRRQPRNGRWGQTPGHPERRDGFVRAWWARQSSAQRLAPGGG